MLAIIRLRLLISWDVSLCIFSSKSTNGEERQMCHSWVWPQICCLFQWKIWYAVCVSNLLNFKLLLLNVKASKSEVCPFMTWDSLQELPRKYSEGHSCALAFAHCGDVLAHFRNSGSRSRCRQECEHMSCLTLAHTALGWISHLFVQDAARLSPTQLKRILELRSGYLQKMDALLRQRKEHVWELQQSTCMCESAAKQDENFGKVIPDVFFDSMIKKPCNSNCSVLQDLQSVLPSSCTARLHPHWCTRRLLNFSSGALNCPKLPHIMTIYS